MSMDCPRNKQFLRREYLLRRKNLDTARKQDGAKQARTALWQLAKSHAFVLSFAPFHSEIDIWEFNHLLAKEHRLLLPKIKGNTLALYAVTDIQAQLIKNKDKSFLEPNELLCDEKTASSPSLALIPGVLFDKNNHRIGYGGGYYDHLLPLLIGTKVGLGYREQLSDVFLPVENHDVALDFVLLF